VAFLPSNPEQATIRDILGRGETAVVLEAPNNGYEIVGVANYPRTCREYYVGRLVLAVFRSEHDLTARLALARARGG
jgi:hypothetical protein